MIARRLATVVVAAAMIVGAFLVRRNLIEGDEGDDDASPPPVEEASELVCLTELQEVCLALGEVDSELTIIVEDAGTTMARLAEGQSVGLWLTFEPFPAMASLTGETQILASSELAIATAADRAAALTAGCTGQALWRCIGDVAGEDWTELGGEESWGRVEPSVGDAGSSAAALASFASAVAGYFGTPQLNSAVWSTDAEFLGWVRRLVREVPLDDLTAGTPLATMLIRPSAVNVAATSDAEIGALGAPAEELAPSYPEPSMWLQAVLATPAGADVPEGLVQAAAATLLAQGWDPPEAAAQPLPSATTMLALRQLWEEIQ